jgi:hypothetical protein
LTRFRRARASRCRQALAHALEDTEASYRRRTATEERRPVMEAYANCLTGEAADNVVAFLPARP